MCFSFSTYFIIFLQDDIIYYMINNSIVILLSVKFIFRCRLMPAVLSRPAFIILMYNVMNIVFPSSHLKKIQTNHTVEIKNIFML